MSLPVDDPVEPAHASQPTVADAPPATDAEAVQAAEASAAAEAPRRATHLADPARMAARGAAVAREICPYLGAASGAWRSAAPHRDHRCEAVDPPTALSTEKQRRLCLTLEHASCPAFRAHRAGRAAMLAPGLDPSVVAVADATRRPIARTSPVVLEQPRLSAPTARWPLDRAVSQAALVVLMVVAFVAVAVARLSSSDAASTPPSALPSLVASATPTPRPTPTSTPSASVEASASVPPSAPVASPAAPRTTYRVKKGDTLIGIAAKYGTSVAAIRRLNGMSGSNLKIGQVLKIP